LKIWRCHAGGRQRRTAISAATGSTQGLSSWGDGRLTLGTEGYIEIRKYVDITRGEQDVVYLVNKEGEFRYPVAARSAPFR
jgi:hypothetical protein